MEAADTGGPARSPLAEPSPVNLDAVWTRQPPVITPREIDAVIAESRRQRAAFAATEAKRAAKREAKEDEEDDA